jgi:DNA-binding transcriptional LysR family regulator
VVVYPYVDSFVIANEHAQTKDSFSSGETIMDRLVAMNVFRRVAELKSFTLAAEQLGLSPASVSKYLAGLEAHLGTPLLTRTTRRMSLTDVGRSYYERCARILEEIEDAEAWTTRQRGTPRGLLKVRAPVSLAALGGAVAAFLARYPEVRIDLTLNDRFTDPVEDGYDVALRIAPELPDSSMIARTIAAVPRVLCAAPSYLLRCGTPAGPLDLRSHNCLVYTRGPAPEEWRFTGRAGERVVHIRGSLRCNNSAAVLDALIAGAGIGLLPAFMVADQIRSGTLKAVLPEFTPQARQLYAIFPNRRQPLPTAREFVHFLAHHFSQCSPFGSPQKAADDGWPARPSAAGVGISPDAQLGR